MKPIDERSHTFVIKIWEERRDQAGWRPIWRGSVDDVQTGQRAYFSSLLQLCGQLRRWSGMGTTRVWQRLHWRRYQ
jgi:hypothetical protein